MYTCRKSLQIVSIFGTEGPSSNETGFHPLSCAALPGSVRKATLPGRAAQPYEQIFPQ